METNNTKRLHEMLKPHREEFDVLNEALKEVSKEDAAKKKDAAKELIRKGLDLQARMDAAERTFNAEKKKFDKELGKTLNRLKNMATGRPLDEGEEKDEKEEKEDAPAEGAQS